MVALNRKGKLSLTEKLVLLLVASMLVAGFAFFFTNRPLFDRYVIEDGVVEWLTVTGLLLGAFTCFGRFVKYLGKRPWIFLAINLTLGLMLFFVAGEEVSWGQRIFNIQSSEYFQQNNLQRETNFHNLLIGGVKINQVVFSIGLIAMLVIYLAVFPFVYRRSNGFKKWVDSWGIVLPQHYQIASFLVLFIITSLLQHEKNAELLECGAGLLFFLIVRYPMNGYLFTKEAGR
ncbi:MAG TPA: hypothetical protein VEY10_19755 [Flavisolibacter sp.]|jgi:hypothetical protein|nr:hypothetical protein [Flavisolibacter sp.]